MGVRYPNGREKNWKIVTSQGHDSGIDGGLTRREYPGQPIGVGIEVDAVDGFIAKIAEHGGKIVLGRTALPNVCWFAVCQDPEENTFIIYERIASS